MVSSLKTAHATIALGVVLTLVNCFAFFVFARRPTWVYVPDSNPRCPGVGRVQKHETEVVMFVPCPMEWSQRRRFIFNQFMKEQWTERQVVLIFVFGTRTGDRLETALDTSRAELLPGAKYIFTPCRDLGDEFNNPNGTSSTTCKVYEACVHIAQHYTSKYVWRADSDAYMNLKGFFRIMPMLPRSRLYLGRYRDVSTNEKDDKELMLSRQPLLQTVFGLFQFGGYMHGEGYVFSYDVAEFIGTLSIPPHQTWCEDVMVGMWLNPFRITKMDYSSIPGVYTSPPLLVHYMKDDWWATIDENGAVHPP